jgi:CTP synthase
MIPHVTGEVKSKLRQLAVSTDADVVFVEIGGTVGDVENAYYIEALRQLAFEEGSGGTCFVALTYVMEPPALGEQKSKAAQLGIKQLMEAGIQPHIVACRAIRPVTPKVREKIAMYSSVPFDRVFSMHDSESIYVVPEMVREAGLDRAVVDILGLQDRVHPELEEKARTTWDDFLDGMRAAKQAVTIGIAGKYTSVRDSYASVIKALEHSGTRCGVKVDIDWIDVTDIQEHEIPRRLEHLSGIIVPAGFGARGSEGKIACIQYARTTGLPYLGLCLGFQMAVIEFARNVCGLAGANSTEIDPDSREPVISILPEQKQIEGLGGNMRLGGQDVLLSPGSLASRLYNGALEVRLRFRHRYEVDPRTGVFRPCAPLSHHAGPGASAGRASLLHRDSSPPRAHQPPPST